MKEIIKKSVIWIYEMCTIPILFGIVIFTKKKHDTLVWGTVPILNNKYWSQAVRTLGFKSITIMRTFYSINKRDDYDLYFSDLIPKIFCRMKDLYLLQYIFSFYFICRNASVVHYSFDGGILNDTHLWRLEYFLLRKSKIRIVVMPYGADAYQYSKVSDLKLRNVLLTSYPQAARRESEISKRVNYWNKHADVVITGFMFKDGLARNDVCIPSYLSIDINMWKKKVNYSLNNGRNGAVKIIHTPNHRGFKGTEFIINVVEKLRSEGYQVELILLEGVPNDKVCEIMRTADILVEQLVIPAYALSAIEGMATGIPVISNLDNEDYLDVFRKYSFLDKCPICSTSIDTLYKNLKYLVEHPEVRENLGNAGRKYVEQYHSYKTTQFLFGNIYSKILDKKDIDLINLFHPLKSIYHGEE